MSTKIKRGTIKRFKSETSSTFTKYHCWYSIHYLRLKSRFRAGEAIVKCENPSRANDNVTAFTRGERWIALINVDEKGIKGAKQTSQPTRYWTIQILTQCPKVRFPWSIYSPSSKALTSKWLKKNIFIKIKMIKIMILV